MGKVHLLDCTLRDGGYVNDWMFGKDNIKGFCVKIARTGIEFLEVGFIKGDDYNPDRAIFPTVDSFKTVIEPKDNNLKYVGMIDMNNPVDINSIPKYDKTSIDGIRVIFKKDKLDAAYDYCAKIKELGYFLSVNFVSTDAYSDEEFIQGLHRFNELKPDAVAIVDTFGLIKRKEFLRMIYIADNNLKDDIILAYHAHNNLQQAFGNAESLVELNLKRDVLIDACVFGMGRGAGNLNLELFAEYMNENYGANYNIEPMLEIMDEYLTDIYREKFWGYSLPLYLTATTGCHPNYAIYLAEKDSLTASEFRELLSSIPPKDKAKFSKERADEIYASYMQNSVDDSNTLVELKEQFADKKILMIAPGHSLNDYHDKIAEFTNNDDFIVISVNFLPEALKVDYVFSNNMKRFGKIKDKVTVPCILTSNVKDSSNDSYIVEYGKYACDNFEIMDNSGIMLLRLLSGMGYEQVYIAGLDGYSDYYGKDYYVKELEYKFSNKAELRNKLISEELKKLNQFIKLNFITPTNYDYGKISDRSLK